jgi:hypothetical protein
MNKSRDHNQIARASVYLDSRGERPFFNEVR